MAIHVLHPLLAVALGVLALACGSDAAVQQPVRRTAASPVQYPRELWDRGIEGETIVAARVSEHGTVEQAYVYHSSGHAALDSAAVQGARALRFVPARQGGEAVAMWVRLPVRFRKQPSAAPRASGAGSGEADAIPGSGGRP